MIRLSFNSTDWMLRDALRTKQAKLVPALEDTLDTLMLQLQRRIQQKLSGEVLQHRSGKALASVNKEPTVREGSRIVGKVTGGAGPAFYLRIQEVGGTRTYDILPRFKKALAFFPGGSVGGSIAAGAGVVPGKSVFRGLYARSGARRGSLKPGKVGTFGQLGGVVVKKVVHPPLPARPSFKTSLLEMQETIVARLRQSAVKALQS